MLWKVKTWHCERVQEIWAAMEKQLLCKKESREQLGKRLKYDQFQVCIDCYYLERPFSQFSLRFGSKSFRIQHLQIWILKDLKDYYFYIPNSFRICFRHQNIINLNKFPKRSIWNIFSHRIRIACEKFNCSSN